MGAPFIRPRGTCRGVLIFRTLRAMPNRAVLRSESQTTAEVARVDAAVASVHAALRDVEGQLADCRDVDPALAALFEERITDLRAAVSDLDAHRASLLAEDGDEA